MKISFDFDGTLSNNIAIREYCSNLVEQNKHEVFIITRRYDEKTFRDSPITLNQQEHVEVYDIAQQLGVDLLNVHFTNRAMKFESINELGINIHIDDDDYETSLLHSSTQCRAICWPLDRRWHNTFDEMLRNYCRKEQLNTPCPKHHKQQCDCFEQVYCNKLKNNK